MSLHDDLEESYFGLDHQIYKSLTQQIDLIFHCGVTANFVLSYSKLYRSDVCST